MTIQRYTVAALIAAPLISALAAACSSGPHEEQDLSAASKGMQQVDSLLDSGNRREAAAAFSRVHGPMHSTATRLAPADSEGAEVINDITEVLDRNLSDPNTELTTLSELSHKAIQFLDQARYLLA